MKFQTIATDEEVIQKLIRSYSTLQKLNYFEYVINIFFDTDPAKLIGFPKTTVM